MVPGLGPAGSGSRSEEGEGAGAGGRHLVLAVCLLRGRGTLRCAGTMGQGMLDPESGPGAGGCEREGVRDSEFGAVQSLPRDARAFQSRILKSRHWPSGVLWNGSGLGNLAFYGSFLVAELKGLRSLKREDSQRKKEPRGICLNG